MLYNTQVLNKQNKKVTRQTHRQITTANHHDHIMPITYSVTPAGFRGSPKTTKCARQDTESLSVKYEV